MKQKSKNIILICTIVFFIIVFIYFIYTFIQYILIKNQLNNHINNTSNSSEKEYTTLGNNTVISVDEDSSIRIINEYDENMFKGHKSLIFFWASWCSHCQEEYEVIQTAISQYKNKGYEIYVISHDYEQSELADFMKKNDFNFEIYFDETRIIRKNLNPEASSVPLTYILDENGILIDSHEGSITLEELDKLIHKNM